MTKLKIASVITVLIFIAACTKDLIVKDIKDASVNVLAPANNLKTTVNSVTFWWDPVDGAEKYNIQIVKPNFAAVQTLVADTNVIGNKYSKTLTPGVYQWRIKAYNAGGSTAYAVYNLVIDTTSNLNSQLVISTSPLGGYLTASKKITFTWSELPSATSYQLQLLDGFTILKDTSTTKTNCSITFSTAANTVGAYSWKVRALNNSSISQYNTPQTFTIDLKAPNPPGSLLPTTMTVITTGTVDLKWTRNGQTVTDVRYDSIYIATDSTFPGFAIVTSARVNASTINTSAFSPALGPSASLTEYYFWKVRSIDSVGNKSAFSQWLKFHINP